MYSTLIQNIKTTLLGISKIKAVYSYPIGEAKLTKYPVAIFFPVSVDNEFHTNEDNFKTYNFKLYLVVGTAGIDKDTLYDTVLPNLLDSVLAEFDEEWEITGTEAWKRINFGNWGTTENGNEAIIDLNIIIKTLTTN